MSPQEALAVLAQVAAKFVGTLEGHKMVQSALEVLKKELDHGKGEELSGLPGSDNQ